jgi:hypothetical protein
MLTFCWGEGPATAGKAQRLPILGSYAELAEVYKRAFQLMAVLHGDSMFGETPQALFLDWMKAFFEKAVMNLMQT